jgi:hypothetical protein
MKRYTSREQIIKDIDGACEKVKKALKVAQEHLDQEELLTGATEKVEELRRHREAADFQFRKIKRLKEVRLIKLKERLAEFDTGALISTSPPDTSQAAPPSLAPQCPVQSFDSSCDVLP